MGTWTRIKDGEGPLPEIQKKRQTHSSQHRISIFVQAAAIESETSQGLQWHRKKPSRSLPRHLTGNMIHQQEPSQLRFSTAPKTSQAQGQLVRSLLTSHTTALLTLKSFDVSRRRLRYGLCSAYRQESDHPLDPYGLRSSDARISPLSSGLALRRSCPRCQGRISLVSGAAALTP